MALPACPGLSILHNGIYQGTDPDQLTRAVDVELFGS